MKQALEKVADVVKKYKYVVLVLLIGIVLLLIPSGADDEETIKTEESHDDSAYVAQVERDLCNMLGRISGAGKVDVMLTMQYGSRTEYQTDTVSTTDSERNSREQKTVILSEGSAYDKAAVSAMRYPQFQGALIICEGADIPSVKLDILNAVSALTGLGTDRITVVKMN